MPTDKQRREAERRRLRRQVQRRAARDARRRRFAVIASIIGVIVLAAVVIVVVVSTGNDHSTPPAARKSSSPSSPTTSTTPAASYPCTWTPGGAAAKKVNPPSTTTPPKNGKVNVQVQTSRGPLTFSLDRSLAPCTVANFLSLAQQGYFNSTSCHRLVTQGIYVLQCGDPTGTGSGGPGYTIPDEATGLETYPAGTIAMARTSSPHSGGSQFFIVYKDSPALQQHLGSLQYTVFGFVTSGLSVVQHVAAAGSDNSNGAGDGKPKLPISLTNVREVK